MNLYNNIFDIYEEIPYTINRGFIKAFEKNNLDMFKTLSKFSHAMIVESIYKKMPNLFQNYIYSPPTYYQMFCETVDIKTSDRLQKVCIETAAGELRDTINHHLKIDVNLPISEIEKVNIFYYHSYTSFALLLYTSIRYKQIYSFEKAINVFTITKVNYPAKLHELSNKLSSLEYSGGSPKEKSDLKEKIAKVNLPFTYNKRVLFALISWLYYLNRVGIYSPIDVINYRNIILNLVKNNIITLNELYEIIYSHGYLGLSTWDYKERPTNVIYSPPSVRDWMILGFAIESLRTGKIISTPRNPLESQVENFELLIDDVIKRMELVTSNYSTWSWAFDNNEEFIKQRMIQLKTSLLDLKTNSISNRENTLAELELDSEQLNQFYTQTVYSWKSSALMHSLFSEFQNLDFSKDKSKLTQPIGGFWTLERAKMAFISSDNDLFREILGISSIGNNLAVWEDDYILNEIVFAKEIIKTSSLLNGVLTAIKKLESLDKKPTLIVISHELSYSQDDFWTNKDLVVKHGIESNNFSGKFQGIPIYYTYSDVLNGKFIVSDFTNAFTLQVIKDSNWTDEIIDMRVTAIDLKRAEEILKIEKDKWSITNDGVNLTHQQTIAAIRTSVELEIWLREKILVKDLECFYTYQITDAPMEQ